MGTHAIGDHAIDWVVDTYAEVLKEKPTSGLRHSIIHANIPTDHAIDTMAFLQKQYDAGFPETQPALPGGSAIPMPATSDPNGRFA